MQDAGDQNSSHDITGHATQAVGDHSQEHGTEADRHDTNIRDDVAHGFQQFKGRKQSLGCNQHWHKDTDTDQKRAGFQPRLGIEITNHGKDQEQYGQQGGQFDKRQAWFVAAQVGQGAESDAKQDMNNAHGQGKYGHWQDRFATIKPERMQAKPGFAEIAEKFAVKDTEKEGIECGHTEYLAEIAGQMVRLVMFGQKNSN